MTKSAPLQFALNFLARTHIVGGDLATAVMLVEEERADVLGGAGPCDRAWRAASR
jgi:hypothetical protein